MMEHIHITTENTHKQKCTETKLPIDLNFLRKKKLKTDRKFGEFLKSLITIRVDNILGPLK